MGKKSRKAKGGGGLGRVDTAAGRALQGLVQSGQIKDGAHIKITDANRGHLAALLGDAKNVRVVGDVQSLRAAVDDPNVELHGGGVVGGRVAGPPAGVQSDQYEWYVYGRKLLRPAAKQLERFKCELYELHV